MWAYLSVVLWGFIEEEGGEREERADSYSVCSCKYKKYQLFFSAFFATFRTPPTKGKKKKKARKEERENLLSYFLWCYGFSIFIKLGLGVREIGCPMNYDLSGYTFLLP